MLLTFGLSSHHPMDQTSPALQGLRSVRMRAMRHASSPRGALHHVPLEGPADRPCRQLLNGVQTRKSSHDATHLVFLTSTAPHRCRRPLSQTQVGVRRW